MEFLWPQFLYLLAIIPLLLGIYILLQRRRRRFSVRYSSLALVRAALPHQSRWRRHLPFALFLLALASLAFTLSRPVAVTNVPTSQTTIVLAIDVSGSMRARDIQPSRLEAAENAAMSFVEHQKAGTQIGIVAFSTYAELIQPPTSNQEELQTAIDSLTTGRRTAIGSGILKSLDAISQVDKNVLPSVEDPSAGGEPSPPPHGFYVPDIVVLLTDGVSNTGPLPLDAAQQAVDRGVRVYTIGFGTPNGSISFGDLFSQGNGRSGNDPFGGNNNPYGGGGGGGFGGFGGFGGRIRTGIDETTLKQVAQMTGGSYHAASSASELESVFNSLPTYLIIKHQTMELSVYFTAAGALLALLAKAISRPGTHYLERHF
jgi:Ca-activated chloride channel family protein